MNKSQISKKHMMQKKLAQRWCISERTLERWRIIGWGPIFLKIGGRVIYREEDILTYEEQSLAASTQSRVAASRNLPSLS
jgi:predicted site-specific integrase-resolvase